MDIKNKVAVITGTSSGIGKATALRLAKEGAKVVLCARSVEELKELKEKIESNGGHALVVKTDVTKPEDWDEVVSQTKSEFGNIDILVNNAGLMPLSFIKKFKTDEWMKMIDVNIKGVLNGVAAILPGMLENGGGHIINISSSAAHRVFPGGAVYSATKAAVKMFSEGMRQELAPDHGINVTSIEPGAVDTNLLETITDDDIKEMLQGMEDIDRLESEDIAESIFYALSQPERVNVNDVYLMPTEQG